MINFYNRNLLLTALFCVTCYVPVAGAMIHLESDNVARVTFSELDLSKQAGVETLYQRLKTASLMVCDTDYRTRSLSTRRAAKKCYNKALDDSVRSIGNSRLDALHNG